ncbi:MAG TPA: hypothetical protein VMY35_14825 [Phycisphaerae bacterium]|nr:hypothetical protein [Phycisphaerae bacterium]
MRYPTGNRFCPIEKDEVGSVVIAFDGVIRRRGGKGAGDGHGRFRDAVITCDKTIEPFSRQPVEKSEA